MGLSTVLGLGRRGFFIPHRYAGDLPTAGGRAPYDAVAALFDRKRGEFAEIIARIDAHAAALEAIGADEPPAPRWRQGWFPRLDAALAYVMVRDRRPARIVEIGSGHSTRFLARAVRDGGMTTRITAIDPAPRASLAGLDVEHRAQTAHEAGLEIFESLRAGDMVFIDSSHILMPGSDVDVILNRVWPALPGGVSVHFHDIFLPDDYPAAWAWRGYNEQLGVAPLITGRGAKIIFSSHYAVTRMSADLGDSVVARLPIVHSAVESSLWLETAAGPEQHGKAGTG